MLTSRLVNGVGFLTCAASLLFAIFYLQGSLDLEPCPLCIFDRVVLIAMGAVFLIALLHNPRRGGQRLYAVLGILLGLIGIGIAGRHVWLQHLPADQVPECGPGLSYMLNAFPFQKTLDMVFRGSGECADIDWAFLGLSIPELTLILFVGLLLLVIVQLLRRYD